MTWKIWLIIGKDITDLEDEVFHFFLYRLLVK